MESYSANVPSSLVSIALTLVLLFSIHLEPCKGSRILTQEPTNTNFIRTSCRKTTYPALCFSSLSPYASSIQTSPMQLAHRAVSAALKAARSTSKAMKTMSTQGGMSPRMAAAMSDCMETMGDSVDELKESMKVMRHIGGKDFGYQLSSIQTWVSAAITNDSTCMDGFEGHAMDGQVKSAVRRHVMNVSQLTSNALALINSLAITAFSPTP